MAGRPSALPTKHCSWGRYDLDVRIPNRFIPAPAGNSTLISRIGKLRFIPAPRCIVGLRFIPAPAGNSKRSIAASAPGPVHPRACGEQCHSDGNNAGGTGSSPRLRGTDDGQIEAVGRLHGSSPRLRGTGLLVIHWFPGSPVHPRACGEQQARPTISQASIGSSPRLRGTEETWGPDGTLHRFIPAPAGNSTREPMGVVRMSVHPRACGEQLMSVCSMKTASVHPRACGEQLAQQNRFIPAPAGNSSTGPRPCGGRSVHPRACGEQSSLSLTQYGASGSSPRLRGTVSIAYSIHIASCFGSSPRLRGTVDEPGTGTVRGRFIPAPAGNSHPGGGFVVPMAVHPRACGEQLVWPANWSSSFGSSPRLRGTDRSATGARQSNRFIPAPAGNRTHRTGPKGRGFGSSPRLRGTEQRRLVACGEHFSQSGSSPRLRGTDQHRKR